MATNPESRTYSRKSAGVLLLVGLLAGVTIGCSVGLIAASSSKSVTVCANKKTNVLRYAKNGKCVTKTETKVVLNQTGAKGIYKSTTQQAVCDGSDADTVANEPCKVRMTGPGGGIIFFVDDDGQYSGFDYLEAAPLSCEGTPREWSSHIIFPPQTTVSFTSAVVGSGQANTTALMTSSGSNVADTSGAAFYADSLSCGSKTDWFLGSIGEMKLMRDNLLGLDEFSYLPYWSSSEYGADDYVWAQVLNKSEKCCDKNYQYTGWKTNQFPVRPVRAF